MINGDLNEITEENNQVIAYEMIYENHCITVLVNLSENKALLTKTYSGMLALSNKNDVELNKQTRVRSLSAYQAVVLYN